MNSTSYHEHSPLLESVTLAFRCFPICYIVLPKKRVRLTCKAYTHANTHRHTHAHAHRHTHANTHRHTHAHARRLVLNAWWARVVSSLPIAGIGRRAQAGGDGAQEERVLSRGLGGSGGIKAEAPACSLRRSQDRACRPYSGRAMTAVTGAAGTARVTRVRRQTGPPPLTSGKWASRVP